MNTNFFVKYKSLSKKSINVVEKNHLFLLNDFFVSTTKNPLVFLNHYKQLELNNFYFFYSYIITKNVHSLYLIRKNIFLYFILKYLTYFF